MGKTDETKAAPETGARPADNDAFGAAVGGGSAAGMAAAGKSGGAAAGKGSGAMGGESPIALFNTRTPHDALFKKALENPRRALRFLQDHVPQLRGRIASAAPVSGDFIDSRTLREKLCDCIIEVILKGGGRDFVFAIAEHKFGRDPLALLQLGKYGFALLERCAELDPASLARPPRIIPLLLYCGKEKWAMPERLDAMFGEGEDALGLQLRCKCVNLAELPADALSGDESLQAAFYAMLYIGGALEGEAQVRDVVARLPQDRQFAAAVLAYLQAAGIGYDEIVSAINEVKPEWGGDNMVNYIKQSWDEGVAAGRVEGRAEGLTHLLQHRFNGDVTPDIRQRIAAASLEEIDAWFHRGIDSPSLEEIFRKPSRN